MMSRIPLLPLLIGIIVGIAGQRFFGSFWVPAAFLAIALLSRRRTNVVIVSLAIVLGWTAADIGSPLKFERLPDSETRFRAIVESVSNREASQTLTLDVDAVVGRNNSFRTYPFRAVATVSHDIPSLLPGDMIEFSGTWSNAEAQTDLPLENDMKHLYYTRGVSLLVFVPEKSLTLIGRSRNPAYELRRWRHSLVGDLYGSGLSPDAAAFISAIVAGETDGISRQRSDDFARAGVAHVLALSGAHVAIVAALLGILLAPIAFSGHRRMRWFVAIVLLWVYAIATGCSASVVRSVIMASAVMLALIYDRPRSSLNSLCLAAIVILVFSPRALFTVGFQLSFIATLGIILFSDRLNPVRGAGYGAKPVSSAVAVTVGATLATMPIVAYTFHQIPVYFLLANIVAAFLMPAMIAGGILLIFLEKAGIASGWIADALNAFVSLFDKMAAGIASFPGSAVENAYFSAWLLIPLYAALALFCIYMTRRKPVFAVAAVALAVASVTAAYMSRPLYDDGELFLIRNKSDMRLIVRRGPEMSIVTSSSPMNRDADSMEIALKYRDYIATRGVRHISFCHVDAKTAPNFRFDFGGKEYKIAAADVESTDSVAAAYCIVNRHFRGDVVALGMRCNADTLLLTADINQRRRNRFMKELKAAGINVIDASASVFKTAENSFNNKYENSPE